MSNEQHHNESDGRMSAPAPAVNNVRTKAPAKQFPTAALLAALVGAIIVAAFFLGRAGDGVPGFLRGSVGGLGAGSGGNVNVKPGDVFKHDRGPTFCQKNGYASYEGSRHNHEGGGLQHDCRDSVAKTKAAVPTATDVFQDPKGPAFCTKNGYNRYVTSRKGPGGVQHDCQRQ